MKILFVSALYPYPLYSGGQIRVYNLLRELSKKHEITLAAFTRTSEETGVNNKLSFCKKVITAHRGRAWQPKYVLGSVLGTHSFLVQSYINPQMRKLLEEELNHTTYDLIHLEPWYVFESLPPTSTPIVSVEHNIEYDVYQKYANSFAVPLMRPFFYPDIYKMRREEEHIWKKSRAVVAVSYSDRKIITKKIDVKHVEIVPNGVALESFRMRKPISYDEKLRLLYVGSFRWMQNRDAVAFLMRDIWPKIREFYPKAKLRIIGKSAPKGLKKTIGEGGAILDEHVDDIAAEYAQAHILIAPLRVGGGTSYKILEAMASGVPVITSSLGAEGLEMQSGREIMIAKNTQEYVDCLQKIVTDDVFRIKLTHTARSIIEKYYDWGSIASKLDAVWAQSA